MTEKDGYWVCPACGKLQPPSQIYYYCPKCGIRLCFSCNMVYIKTSPTAISDKCPMCLGEWISNTR